MAYSVPLSERERFERDFAAPFPYSAYTGDEELRRDWPILHEGPGQVLLRHGSGAVASLARSGDRITAAKLIEGAEARALIAKHGYRPSEESRARVSRAFVRGAALDTALNAAFPRRLGLSELLGPASDMRLFRVTDQGVLAVRVDAAGLVQSSNWRVGGDALDAIEAHEALAQWAVPPFPQQSLPVRTPAEAALFVRVQRGEILAQRQLGAELQILARTPEGRRRFSFRPERLSDLGPTDFGEGRSPVLDPVELALFAAQLQAGGAPPEDLALGAAAARQALRFYDPGADLPSPETLRGAASAGYLRRQPERMRRANLEKLAEDLERLAGGSVGGSAGGAAEMSLRARSVREARWRLRGLGFAPDVIVEQGDRWRVPLPGGGDRGYRVGIAPDAPAMPRDELRALSQSIARGLPPHPEVLADALAEHAAGEAEEALACLAAAGAPADPDLGALARALRAKPAAAPPAATPVQPLPDALRRPILGELAPGRALPEALQALAALGLRPSPLVDLPPADGRRHRLIQLDGVGLGMLSIVTDAADRILGRALLSGEPARAQRAFLEAAALRELSGQQQALAAHEALVRALEPALRAAATGDPGALQALLPRPGDAARAFQPAAAPKVEAAMARWLASADPPRILAGAGRTELRVHAAPVGALAAGHPLAEPFPGAYRALAQEHLKPGRTWVCWVFHAPGQAAGMRYDGLVWLDDHWAWFPKPWRALK